MSEYVTAIDPGPETSGVVELEFQNNLISPMVFHSIDDMPTKNIVSTSLNRYWYKVVIIEDVINYGRIAGASIIGTAKTIGRCDPHETAILFARPTWGAILCGIPNCLPSQVRARICEIYTEEGKATGGGADPVFGTKKQPGPLFLLRGQPHALMALGMAIAWRIRELGK